MAEVKFKVDVPPELESEFKVAVERVVGGLIEELEFSVAMEILSKSKLTERQAEKLAEDVKKRIAKKHGVL